MEEESWEDLKRKYGKEYEMAWEREAREKGYKNMEEYKKVLGAAEGPEMCG